MRLHQLFESTSPCPCCAVENATPKGTCSKGTSECSTCGGTGVIKEKTDEVKNPDGHHHTSNEPFIDPDGPQDEGEKVETAKGNIYTWAEADRDYSMYGKFTYEGGEFTMYYDPQMGQFDNREPIQGDPKAQQVIDSLPDEYFANDEKETVISGIIDMILEYADPQTEEVEEAEELNDIRRRAGLEVKEGDGTENDCKHCGGLGTHKDEDGEKYDCERCQGTGQIGNDEQDEPTNDGTPAYKKYINSTNTEGLDLSSVVDSIVETDSEVNVMDMEDEELHAYVGQKEEDLVQDMIHHFAPDYVGKDNFEERYMQYREEVLEPAAQDVSADKNADDMAGTDYDSEDFVDNHNMVGDDEVNQEESIDEFKQSEFNLDEPDGYYSLISNTGKDVQVGQQIDKLQKPNKLVTVVPPSGGIPALAIIMNARGQQIKVTQDSLSQIGYKIVARKDPTAPSNADQSPRQPDLPGLNSVQPEVVETAIDNALEETMSELRKLAGL